MIGRTNKTSITECSMPAKLQPNLLKSRGGLRGRAQVDRDREEWIVEANFDEGANQELSREEYRNG
jgi:hypothetical protein